MGKDDPFTLCVDHLVTQESPEEGPSSKTLQSPPHACVVDVTEMDKHSLSEEEEPFIQTTECRICQEEDIIKNLEVPCGCNGSLKYAHRKCVQRWCNEKGDIICEICHQPYRPGYTTPSPPPHSDDTSIDISEGWVTGTTLDLHDPRLLAMATAERHLLDAEINANKAAFCRSAALILMALLLLRHALSVPNGDDDDDASAFFSLILLRAAGFLLPCYIMAWAISILQRRRQNRKHLHLLLLKFRLCSRQGNVGACRTQYQSRFPIRNCFNNNALLR